MGHALLCRAERLTGEAEDFRSDIYSLGATLFHAVAGRTTFQNETHSAAELKRLKASPLGLRVIAPDVSDETAAVVDRMLRPNPKERQTSYKELIDQLQSAHAAAIEREEALRGHWSWPVRILVSLGGLLLAIALVGGIVFGLQHLPRRSTTATPAPEAVTTPASVAQAQLEAAQRELQGGHYAAAEALLRQIAATVPNVEPLANLCAALQLWDRGDFAQAATMLKGFVKTK